MLRRLLACALLLAGLGWAGPAQAAGVVPNCSSDADLISKLSGGGRVTFACGPATIVLGSTQTINLNTTIDGSGKITLSGGGARRLFVVSHNRLQLDNIV